jgi:two-component system, LuxR family, sensor kinase FixL
MNDLLEVLDARQDAIRRALADRLKRANCPELMRILQGDPAEPDIGKPASQALFDAFHAACRDSQGSKARQWAANLLIKGRVRNLHPAEVMGALYGLERVVRVQIARSFNSKRVMLIALSRAGVVIEQMRRAYIEASYAEGPGERDQLKLSLAEAQSRKHAILESALDPIITIDHNGAITEFNRAAELVFGHSRQKVLGSKPSDILFPSSKSIGQQDRIDRYLDLGEGSMLGKRVEITAIRASGETFPAEMAMTISQEHGSPVLTFFVRDISLRKQAEREQARYAAELERSNRELEQFASIASHDLQEPLRKIQTFSDRLEMKCKEQLDDVGRECIQRMQSAAARMQVLIEGLLTLSRVTTRGQDFVPVDLAEVAKEVVSDLEVRITKEGGRVELHRLPTIQADPLQMRQLLQNLIGNAVKFHRVDEPPVVKVSGRYVQGQQQNLSVRSMPEHCRILVEDNGIGFEEKHQERIFGVFQRLHPRDVFEGTGIGLAICRRIVERHGGTISARSTPGKGSTFEVLLPVIQARKEP